MATSSSGVVTITGGKLTTYRHMAADTVDAAVEVLGDSVAERIARRSPTAKLRLRGAEGYEELAASTDARTRVLARRHGGEANVVLAMIEHDPSLGEPLVAGGLGGDGAEVERQVDAYRAIAAREAASISG